MLPNCLKQEDNIDKLSIPDLFLFINKDPLLRNVHLDSKLYSHHSQSCQMLFFFSCTSFHQKWSTPISVPSINGEISPFICKHLHFFVTLLQHLQCLIEETLSNTLLSVSFKSFNSVISTLKHWSLFCFWIIIMLITSEKKSFKGNSELCCTYQHTPKNTL